MTIRGPWIWGSLLGVASLAALGFGGDVQDEQTREIEQARGLAVEPDTPDPTASEAREAQLGAPTPAGPIADGHSGVLAVDRHGLLIVERSAGELVRADRSGKRRASLKLQPGLGELVLDRGGRAFVADRQADRVVRVDVDGPERLRELASVAVPEPHGLALTPDGSTLLITSVSEHALVALDAETLAPRWELELAPEPRAVAVSPDGGRAAVGFLSSGSLALIDLDDDDRRIRWSSLEPRDHVETERDDYEGCEDMFVTRIVEARSRFSVPVETGRRYARNVYALAYVSDTQVVAPHQRATPQLQRVVAREAADSYGGLSDAIKPIVHELARVDGVDAFEISTQFLGLGVHQPRALAYEPAADRLFVAGYGDDRIVVIDAASQPGATLAWSTKLELPGKQACGIDGLTVDEADARGRGLWVHCEFGRRVARLDLDARTSQLDEHWETSEVLAESARPADVEHGAELFRRSDSRISDGGDLACSNCHPEGRSDGLTWRLGKSILQAPVLAGRVHQTGPYKWDGQDATLHDSLEHTMSRLGGWPGSVSSAEFDALVAYLESLPPPKPPSSKDPGAIARGRAVFEAASCDACHEGDALTDQAQHELDTTLRHVDTPSLIGLAHSRPYFHDGSAPDLWTLLTDRGTVHDMADTSDLSDEQLRDLVAYLESL